MSVCTFSPLFTGNSVSVFLHWNVLQETPPIAAISEELDASIDATAVSNTLLLLAAFVRFPILMFLYACRCLLQAVALLLVSPASLHSCSHWCVR